jgi:signal transduction histidine kinase
MKPVKLLTFTSVSYFLIFSVLLTLAFTVFLKFLQVGVDESIDELLLNRKKSIIRLLQAEGKLPENTGPFSDYIVSDSAKGSTPYEAYTDTLIFDKVDKEAYMYRKLSSAVKINDRYYKIDVVLPLIEEEDVVDSVIRALVLVFISILIVFYFSSRILSKRMFIPFYKTLYRLNGFRVDTSAGYVPVNSKICEFNDLNKSLTELTDRARESFLNQKKFIENASHELLTPLAVTQNKLEELAGDANLTAHQSQLIQILINVNQRVARLNKTLLLLSKIENGQYPETQKIMLKPLIDDIIALFEEQKAGMMLNITILVPEEAAVTGNYVLLELLLTNLIKNAFVHNYTEGNIVIDFSNNQLGISNTSATSEIPEDSLYRRFYKNSSRKESWGLGLAIVKNICTVQNWDIKYYHINERHVFQLSFTAKE